MHAPNEITKVCRYLRPSWKASPAPAFRAAPVPRDLATAAFYAAVADDDPAELYDNAPCGYLSTLPDGTIIKANATFLAWTGYDRDALIGRRRFQDLLAVGLDETEFQTAGASVEDEDFHEGLFP